MILPPLSIQVSDAALTHVSPTWEDINFVPTFNRLYFIRSGRGFVRVGDQEYRPVADDLVLLPAHIRQSYGCDGDDRYLKYWCHFSCPVGDQDLFNLVSAPVVVRVADPGSLVPRFAHLVDLFQRSDLASGLRLGAVVLGLLADFLALTPAGTGPHPGRPGDERLRPVLGHIEEHLSEVLTLADLAGLAHLQQTYFVTYFRKHLGVSPMRYVHLRRMERAKGLLTGSDLLVTEVALRVGMADLFHFSKDFKAHTGFSPSEYRQLRRGA